MSKPLPIYILALLFVACTADSPMDNARADEVIETEEETVRLVQIAEGLEHPWAVAFLPDGRYLVTERPGRLNVIEDGEITRISGLPEIHAQNQGGLMEVVLHPAYEENGWIYMTYSKPVGGGQTVPALIRARLDGTSLADLEELFESNEPTSPGRHYGSRLLFLDDGTLLMTIGDRGQRDPSQDVTTHTGTTVRLNDDGSVPDDNPTFDQEGAVPELYSYGHRNAQGMDIHPQTREVWQHEHGPRGGDELNLIEPGNNYGWPEITYGVEYGSGESIGGEEAPGMEQPVIDWTPSIAPSGMTFYSGDAFPNWQNDLFVGALAFQQIHRVRLEGHEAVHEEIMLDGTLGRIRDVREGPDGFIYILNDQPDGGLYRLEPANE